MRVMVRGSKLGADRVADAAPRFWVEMSSMAVTQVVAPHFVFPVGEVLRASEDRRLKVASYGRNRPRCL